MDKDNYTNNRIYLQGKITGDIEFSHRIYEETFYVVYINCKRMSGTYDNIPVTVTEKILNEIDLNGDNFYLIKGQIRSYNRFINGKNKLVITVFARTFEIIDDENEGLNSVHLEGYVCKLPNYRKTPFLREICDLLVAVNRPHHKSDYIPVIAWGHTARIASNLLIGKKILITGRLQSRSYMKHYKDGTSKELIAYEVSAMRLEYDPCDPYSY